MCNTLDSNELFRSKSQHNAVNRVLFMSDITIEVWDATGNKRQSVEVPTDAAVNRVIAVLVDRMTLPRHSPDGQLMSYKFHHKASGRQLLDTQTLSDASVEDGDVLRLQPEITAGGIQCMAAVHSGMCTRPGMSRTMTVPRKC